MTLADKIRELVECVADYEIEYQPHIKAIIDLAKRVDFYNPNENYWKWEEVFVDYLFQKYCEQEYDLQWDEHLEELGLYEDWLQHKKDKHNFLAKYGLHEAA